MKVHYLNCLFWGASTFKSGNIWEFCRISGEPLNPTPNPLPLIMIQLGDKTEYMTKLSNFFLLPGFEFCWCYHSTCAVGVQLK